MGSIKKNRVMKFIMHDKWNKINDIILIPKKHHNEYIITNKYIFINRNLDFLFSLIIIIQFSPILLYSCIFYFIYNRFIIFEQKDIGKFDKYFYCHKFRKKEAHDY